LLPRPNQASLTHRRQRCAAVAPAGRRISLSEEAALDVVVASPRHLQGLCDLPVSMRASREKLISKLRTCVFARLSKDVADKLHPNPFAGNTFKDGVAGVRLPLTGAPSSMVSADCVIPRLTGDALTVSCSILERMSGHEGDRCHAIRHIPNKPETFSNLPHYH
jgi:hypothetical protein